MLPMRGRERNVTQDEWNRLAGVLFVALWVWLLTVASCWTNGLERTSWRNQWCRERLATTTSVAERLNLYREVPQCAQLGKHE